MNSSTSPSSKIPVWARSSAASGGAESPEMSSMDVRLLGRGLLRIGRRHGAHLPTVRRWCSSAVSTSLTVVPGPLPWLRTRGVSDSGRVRGGTRRRALQGRIAGTTGASQTPPTLRRAPGLCEAYTRSARSDRAGSAGRADFAPRGRLPTPWPTAHPPAGLRTPRRDCAPPGGTAHPASGVRGGLPGCEVAAGVASPVARSGGA
jgi:hypothetical protein